MRSFLMHRNNPTPNLAHERRRKRESMLQEMIDGKPYAANPHVRFDAREVASARPRHMSLFRRSLSILTCVLTLASVECVWGRTVSLDLRQIGTVKQSGRRLLTASPSAVAQDGVLRTFDLNAGAADVGEVALGDELTFTLFDDVAITLTLKKKMPPRFRRGDFRTVGSRHSASAAIFDRSKVPNFPARRLSNGSKAPISAI